MEKLLNHKRPKGFTLVELLVYISVTTIALMVFVTFMVDVSRSAARARTVQELHQNAQFVMDRLAQEVRSSKVIIFTDPPSKFDVQVGSLALTTSTGDTHTFTLDTTNPLVGVIKLNGDEITNKKSVNVTKLMFTKAGSAVKIELQVKENTTLASPQSIDLQTTLVPRQEVYK